MPPTAASGSLDPPPAEPFDPIIDVEFGVPVLGGTVWVDYFRGSEPMHAVIYLDENNAVETCLIALVRLSGFDASVSLMRALDLVGGAE